MENVVGPFSSQQVADWWRRYKHYVFAFLIQLFLAGLFIHDWDGFVFSTSARQFLEGITPYQVAAQAPAYTFAPSPPWKQEWYAYPPLPLLLYTPSYALYLLSPLGGNPIAERIFLKLPFILGNLLCAYLVYKVVRGISSEQKAKKAELLILYNPFLIFIAAVWGMFDIWMLNFVLLSFLCLRRDRFAWAGVFFGLSLLIKPIAVVFAPVFLAHIYNKAQSKKQLLIWGSAGAATFSLLSLPFFLSSPQGFLNQVFLMNLFRPAQGWTPLTALDTLSHLEQWLPLGFPQLNLAAISSILTDLFALLLVCVLFLIFVYYLRKRETKEKELLFYLFLAMLAFTLFNKVVNAQYFVLSIALAIILIYSSSHYELMEVPQIRQYYKLLTYLFVPASIIAGFHFLTFWPNDIGVALWGKPMAELFQRIASSPHYDWYATAVTLSSIAIAFPILVKGWFIMGKSGTKIIDSLSQTTLIRQIREKSRMASYAFKRPVLVFLTVLLMLAAIPGTLRAFPGPEAAPSQNLGAFSPGAHRRMPVPGTGSLRRRAPAGPILPTAAL